MHEAVIEQGIDAGSGAWREHFYQQYDPITVSDDFASRYPYLQRLIKQHIPRDGQLRIVDLGCGKGTLLQALRQNGYENLTGVDLSPSQIAVARARSVGRIQESDCLSFAQDSGESAFDVVFTFDVIEHLTREELMALGKEIRRILAPGARWIIHAPNAAGIFGNRVRYADATHEQAFTPDSIAQWAEKLGFRESYCYEDKPVVHGFKSLLRRGIWQLIRTAAAICLAAESGQTTGVVLSQNLVAVLIK